MKKVLVIFVVLSFSIYAQDTSQTEAGSSECVGECSPVNNAMKLCHQSLPDYCKAKKIKEEHSICHYGFTVDESIERVGMGTVNCAIGIFDGIIDVLVGLGQVATGAFNLLTDSEYRSEAMSATSFFIEELNSHEDGLSTAIKELISHPILAEVDEFVNCLNGYGRINYICESGSQALAILKVFSIGKRAKDKIKKIKPQKQNFNLSGKDKRAFKRSLKKILRTRNRVSLDQLHPYQISLLTPSVIKNKINLGSESSDELLKHMSDKQLHALSEKEVIQIRDTKANIGDIDRLSNDQFQAWVKNRIEINGKVVNNNLHRLDENAIARLNPFSVGDIHPSVLAEFSTIQSNALAPSSALWLLRLDRIKHLPERDQKLVKEKAIQYREELKKPQEEDAKERLSRALKKHEKKERKKTEKKEQKELERRADEEESKRRKQEEDDDDDMFPLP